MRPLPPSSRAARNQRPVCFSLLSTWLIDGLGESAVSKAEAASEGANATPSDPSARIAPLSVLSPVLVTLCASVDEMVAAGEATGVAGWVVVAGSGVTLSKRLKIVRGVLKIALI